MIDPPSRRWAGLSSRIMRTCLATMDRQDSLIEGTPYNAGLFHSGAGFGDDEFFKLYRRVAEAIPR
jgi:hypothetical protein